MGLIRHKICRPHWLGRSRKYSGSEAHILAVYRALCAGPALSHYTSDEPACCYMSGPSDCANIGSTTQIPSSCGPWST